jgi:flagellar motor protein MotB
MASKCRCKPHECEECPEWIFTFADLVMLMMGFFVILWVLKPNPGKKGADAKPDENWVKTVIAIRQAFGYVPDPHSHDPIDIRMLLDQLAPRMEQGPGNGGKTDFTPKGPVGIDQDVQTIRQGHQATEGGKMLFDKGSADLTEQTKKDLAQVADIVRGHRNIVMIKGHTSLDDFPDGTSAEQKMDLSLRRAQAASDFLTQHGVDPQIIRVQGCSTFEPLTQRQYTADSQSLNRRVEVEATATLVEDLQAPTSQPTDNVAPANGTLPAGTPAADK